MRMHNLSSFVSAGKFVTYVSHVRFHFSWPACYAFVQRFDVTYTFIRQASDCQILQKKHCAVRYIILHILHIMCCKDINIIRPHSYLFTKLKSLRPSERSTLLCSGTMNRTVFSFSLILIFSVKRVPSQ